MGGMKERGEGGRERGAERTYRGKKKGQRNQKEVWISSTPRSYSPPTGRTLIRGCGAHDNPERTEQTRTSISKISVFKNSLLKHQRQMLASNGEHGRKYTNITCEPYKLFSTACHLRR